MVGSAHSRTRRTLPGRGVPFVDRLASFGPRTAVATGEERISYRELDARVERRAAALGDGRRLVMISGTNTLETLVSYLASLRGRHVPWLVPNGDSTHAASLVATFEPDVVVSSVGGRTTLTDRGGGSRHDLHPDLALLLGTSGSTGAPRLVRLSHDNLQSNADAIARSLGITRAERAITSLPMHYCYGLSVVNSHLSCGAQLLLTDLSVTDEGFWSLFRDGGATSFAGVPHTFDLLDRVGFETFELPHLRYITQAGGRLSPAAVRRYAEMGARQGWQLVVMYGQTEATARMAVLPPHLAAANPNTVGVPIPGGSFELRPTGDIEDSDVGEIVYRGPNVMLGYAESPEDLALGRVVHELRTGDLGRRTPSGLYEIVGRRSRFLKIFGLRVDLQDLERILHESGVSAVCAGSDARLAIAVTGDASTKTVASLVVERLGIPRGSVAVSHHDAIPLLPSGKPDYEAISQNAAGGGETHRSPQAVPDGGGRSAAVAAVFCDILGQATVKDTDTFSGLGGDSLSYVEMSLALEEAIGHLPQDWPDMEVQELAALERPRGRMTQIETGVALRAAAITLVVLSHMTAFWPAGGAHLLLAIAGHNFARFQLSATRARGWLGRWSATIGRIALPASAYISLQVVLFGGYSVGAMLLVNNYTGAPELTGGRWHYWFFESLVQILIVLTGLIAIPWVRRLEWKYSFAFVLTLLALALTFRFDLLAVGGDANKIFRPHAVVWLFLIGWAVQRATSPARKALMSVIVLTSVPGFFGQPAREAIVISGLVLLIWLPVVVVPRPLHRVCGAVAAASMYIYLTHWQVWPLLTEVLPFEVAVAATISAGVATWFTVERLSKIARRWWSSGRAISRARTAVGERTPRGGAIEWDDAALAATREIHAPGYSR